MDYLEIRKEVEELNMKISDLERQKRKTCNINEKIRLTNRIASLKLKKECVLNSSRQ